MSLVGATVMSAYLISPTGQTFYNSEDAAVKYTGKALYKQFDIDKYVKVIEKNYLPEELRKYGPYAMIVARAIRDKRVSYEWTF